MKLVRLAMIAAGAFAISAAHAAAATISATITGNVTTGSDLEGIFAPIGTDLTGDAFTASFTLDTTIGVFNPWNPGGIVYGGGPEAAYYGPAFSPNSPGSGSLTINGATLTLGETAVVGIIGNPLFLFFNASVKNVDYFGFAFDGPTVPTTLGVPFSGDPCASPLSCGGVLFFGGGLHPKGSLALRADHLDLSYQGTFVVPTFVPEPDVWVLLLVGVGGIGAALRGPAGRKALKRMVDAAGIEPATPTMST